MSHVMGPGILEFPGTLMEVAVFKIQSLCKDSQGSQLTYRQTAKGHN